MKKHIKKVLEWALSKFEPDPAEIAAWPFPVASEAREKRILELLAEDRPRKRAPALKKATTRTVAKKATKVAKKAK